MVNILWKKNTAGTFTLFSDSKFQFIKLTAKNNNSKGNKSTDEIPAITPSPAETLSKSSAMFVPFAISSNVSALQSNNIVNTRVAYDIIFKTASGGAIKNVEMTFPPGIDIRNATILEVSGIGRGATP